MIQISEDQFIKRLPIDTFKRQKRGGKGVQGASTKRDDFIKIIRVASTHDNIMLFSNRGKVFMMKVYELPVGTKEARGKSLKAIINLGNEESITSICTFKEFSEDAILMATKNGVIKKSPLSVFSNTKKNGIIAIGLDEKDQLIYVNLLKPEQDVIIASKRGLAVRTNLAKLRTQGRTAGGVRGMRLSEGDFVTGVTIVEKDSDLLVITEKGYGKRMEYAEFATKGRGGRGMTYLKITEKNGSSVGISSIKPTDEVIIIAQSGMIIRMEAKDISVIGRSTQGVRVVNLKDDDSVIDFAVLESE